MINDKFFVNVINEAGILIIKKRNPHTETIKLEYMY